MRGRQTLVNFHLVYATLLLRAGLTSFDVSFSFSFGVRDGNSLRFSVEGLEELKDFREA